MRRREVVKIENKEYTVKELTIAEIIELVESSYFFGGGTLKDDDVEEQKDSNEASIKNDLAIFTDDIVMCMQKSCDFGIDDIKKLAPSEVKIIYDKWKEVNSDFLSIAKALGLSEILLGIKDAVLSSFSKLLATLSNADT